MKYEHTWYSASDLPLLKINQSKLIIIKYSTGEEIVVEFTLLSNKHGSFITLEGEDVTKYIKGWKPL